MTRKIEQPDSHSPLNDEDLDAWLAQAEWPEPPAESIDRLRRRWRELRGAVWTLRLAPAFAAAAAIIVVAAGGAWWILWSDPRVPVTTNVEARPPERVTVDASLPILPERPKASGQFTTISRPPTPIELTIVAAMERRGARVSTTAPTETPAPPLDPVTDAIARLAREPDGDIATIVADLRQQLGSDALIARRLQAVASHRMPEERKVAERLLVQVADVPTLIKLARRDGGDPSIRSAAVSALLNRPTPDALNAYLALVADPWTRAMAIRASDEVRDPPIEALFARLYDPRVDTRVAAALTLGRINGLDVTRRLAVMVEQDVNRREALIALAASRGPDARAYLAQASEIDELSAAVRSAMAQRTAYQ